MEQEKDTASVGTVDNKAIRQENAQCPASCMEEWELSQVLQLRLKAKVRAKAKEEKEIGEEKDGKEKAKAMESKVSTQLQNQNTMQLGTKAKETTAGNMWTMDIMIMDTIIH